MKRRFARAISLGMACETAFQIRRQFGPLARYSGVFDHQITPPIAVLEYFSSDFRGLLELDDLEVTDDGTVVNRRFGTQHPHEFPRGIEKSYVEARSRHDYLCAKLRNSLDENVPTLFVLHGTSCAADDLRTLIQRRNPRLDFELLTVRTHAAPTRPEFKWQGNDAEWKLALCAYDIAPAHYFRRQAKRLLAHIATARF